MGLFVVAGLSVGSGLLHAFFPNQFQFDDKTAMFFGVAVAALVIHQITKFKGFGIEFENEVKQIKEDIKGVEAAVGNLEKGVGPGSKTAVAPGLAPSQQALASSAIIAAMPVDPDDPNKGQFGGSSEVNGRHLSATIVPEGGAKSALCRVRITIVSTDSARPLTGKVTLHLHPTFGQWSSCDLDVKGGVAMEEIVSYGAFTVGAESDGGMTRLELDLIDVPGGTTRFYQS